MKRFIAGTACFYLLVCVLLIGFFSDDSESKMKNAEVNDIIFTIKKYYPDVDSAIKILQGYETDYIVIGEDGREIGASRQGLVTDYHYDYIHRDYSVEILKDGKEQGKIIFINTEPGTQKKYWLFCVIMLMLFLLKDIVTVWYLRKNILYPVRKINEFAGMIAKGNLDIPVGRVDSSFFGAFSESFDIMREELAYAKRKEREADRQRREVIASISHDIKNPVASIQAIAEYQFFTNDSEELRQEFQTIIEKAYQINRLVINLHTSMMNDLERLEVNPEAVESSVIEKLLLQADFKKRIEKLATERLTIPECLIMMDKIRFSQVADNVISNSYKYADTKIEVGAYFEDQYLCVCIRDFGNGVQREEEVFLTQKYFRGKNAREKEGSGMGLYIAEYLMKGMGGKLICRSKENEWFAVEIWLALAV